jgi:thioredoxin 1
MKPFALWPLSILLPLVLIAGASAQGAIPQEAQDQVKKAVSVIESAKQPSDYAEAVKAFEAAIRVAPNWPDVHYNLARVLAEINKPVRAVKEYRRYLELSPNAEDKGKIDGAIKGLQEMKATQKKIGMSWISFGEMPDGIYVLHVFPGSPVEKGSLQRGDKITAVNGKPVGGVSLVDFFRILEEGLSAQTSATMRMSARGGTPIDPRDWVAFSMIRAGKELWLTVRKNVFSAKSYEIEDDEFEGEVLQSSAPIFVTFWAKWCPPCQKTTPIVEGLSQKYGDKVRFVTINMEENRAYADKLEVKGIPTMILFRDGKPLERLMGMQSTEKIEGLIKMGL